MRLSTEEKTLIGDEIQQVFGLQNHAMSESSKLSAKAIQVLASEKRLGREILEILQAEIDRRLIRTVVPRFWDYFKHSEGFEEMSDLSKANIFQESVNDLYQQVSSLSEYIQRMDFLARDLGFTRLPFGESSFTGLFKQSLKGALHSQLPPNYEEPIRSFYSRALHVFHSRRSMIKTSTDDEEMEDDCETGTEDCKGCKKETDSCECNLIIASFHDTNQKLLYMDLLERLTSNVVNQIVHNHIKEHVRYTCHGSFTVSHLRNLENWLDIVVMGWIKILYTASIRCREDDFETAKVLKKFRPQLCHNLYEIYTKARIDQLFNIMIEFPDSQPALEDLKECLDKTDLRTLLVKSLKDILKQKLLHLGVTTADILLAYVTAIKALRFLDPSGVLLELVCDPVRKYLRSREDTVKCIVEKLIDDSCNELADELLKTDKMCTEDNPEVGEVDLDATEVMDSWQDWQPDPVDADPSSSSRSTRRRSADIISMLVNIYGSKDKFVEEYRSLLSNRLLTNFHFDPNKEIRNLELLKIGFGESVWHQCEVMLKDISDSKRINTAILDEDGSANNLPFPMYTMILSAQFWPPFKEQDTLQLPKEVSDCLSEYAKAFESMKKIRTLQWKPHLGCANLDIELGDHKLNVTVSAVHAAIIYMFQEKSEWTAEELSQALKVPLSTVQKKIILWQNYGIIKEAHNRYTLVESSGPLRRMSGPTLMSGEEEPESFVRTSHDQRAEELQVFWSYIVNMLINLESLSLDRIFQMLKMFAMQGAAVGDCDINQLRAFLDEKVRQHELVYSAGQYKLPQP